MKRPEILVIGSMNMDLYIRGANSIPKFGESIVCGNYGYAVGGKGANQAFAAAAQGANVTLVGRVGRDKNGEQLLSELEKGHVNTKYIVIDEVEQTGLALMMIEDTGKYVSYVSMGANDKVCFEDVKKALESQSFDMILIQLEIPLETVYQTLELAKEKKIAVFLDAGPAMSIPLEKVRGLMILSPNEAETEALTGIYPGTDEKAVMAAQMLYEQAQPAYVILKRGEHGVLIYDGDQIRSRPCFPVEVVDSTAAGDTFGAALAIRLCLGESMNQAVEFAQAAAAICVSRKGALMSIPSRQEVESFLKNRKECA